MSLPDASPDFYDLILATLLNDWLLNFQTLNSVQLGCIEDA